VQREKSADPDIQLICDDSNIFKWTALVKVTFNCRNRQYQSFNKLLPLPLLIVYLYVVRALLKHLMKVVFFNLRLQFQSSILCCLHKFDF